ncbi:conjugative transposon protein TraN [Pedobacter sp. P351]|uniref:conjugative transposon protein TraN n=1 Tax=Pedobacter superstes TaxID=3133441 RepID=UPI0030B76BD4
MKYLLFITSFLLTAKLGFAQFQQNALQKITISSSNTIHLISPEPITYVDIASSSLVGDLPLKNILRLKLLPDSVYKFSRNPEGTIITVVGESYIAQYQVRSSSRGRTDTLETKIAIVPEHMSPLDVFGISLTTNQLKAYCLNLVAKKEGRADRKMRGYNLEASLSHVYISGDYIFLDISYQNKTNLPFDIDEVRFKVEDKKINKATNVQSVEIKPVFTLFDKQSFKKHYRNVYVFRKFSYPGNKLLHVSLTEKQFSGRNLDLKIPYQDILDADIIPFQ